MFCIQLSRTSVVPLFWFTEIKLGGFGLSPFRISMFMVGGGVSQTLWVLFAFPPLQHKFGTGAVLRACSIIWPIAFALCPLLNLLLRNNWNTAFWIAAPFFLMFGSGASMAFGKLSVFRGQNCFPWNANFRSVAIQLALNDIAPTHETLGTLNGVALTVVSAVRAFSPALFSSIFAIGADSQALGGYLIWLVLIILALGYSLAIHWLPEKAEGKLTPNVGSE